MSSFFPEAGMALAAGLGLRMRPLTESTPKALLPVAGKTLLDHTLDHFSAAGLKRAVVNTHYKADQITRHVNTRSSPPPVTLSHEETLLETGGGVKKALPVLGPNPFFVINADIVVANGPNLPMLQRLAQAWDETRMDALLLLIPVSKAVGLSGAGDYAMDSQSRLTRRVKAASAPYFYAAVQLIAPAAYSQTPAEAFSNLLVWDQAQDKGRLYGLIHDGDWYHVGDPHSLAQVNALLSKF